MISHLIVWIILLQQGQSDRVIQRLEKDRSVVIRVIQRVIRVTQRVIYRVIRVIWIGNIALRKDREP